MKSRFKKEERYNQLLDLAIEIVRDQGTDALTLISLAKKAGVTKPITYNHFSNRQLLLFSLYRRCDEALSSQMDHLNTNQSNSLKDAVTVYVSSYINCIETNGKLYDDIVSALKAYPEYASVENDIRDYFCHVIEKTFSPFVAPDGHSLTKLKLISIFSITESLGGYLKENPQNKNELIDEAVEIILSICNH
ncbi:TetR/AcrR family transcriptional regulator [Photobacterium sp. TY1-4]|uniref:TetR/AcrR family transcriptional regulator n=1 Tax=Photobacterium sp. TY1-4 TaxID=2899122 RepID=UPI0021C117CC|nr:TetR/AcrR family transcriptional regulator [Photobacterium sp. TY1-4]UXH99930.1 TetR/AcrR family transcriptional regulator [Photobacterium sp. TY1-4]